MTTKNKHKMTTKTWNMPEKKYTTMKIRHKMKTEWRKMTKWDAKQSQTEKMTTEMQKLQKTQTMWPQTDENNQKETYNNQN